jgi:hypothetical protein
MQPVVKTYSTVPMMALKDRKSFIKAIRTAKRVASGKRAAAACTACKKSRARCDDTRPCKRCRNLGICADCAMPDLAEVISSEGSSSMYIRTVGSYQQQLKVDVGLTVKPEPRQANFNSSEAQEVLHARFLPKLQLDEFKASWQNDSNLLELATLSDESSSRLHSSFAGRANHSLINVALGPPFSHVDFMARSVHEPVGVPPALATAIIVNNRMLGAAASWNQQQFQHQHQQQLLYAQQLQFNQTLANLLLGQHAPLATCPRPPFGGPF